MLCGYAGLRAGEALGLRAENVDLAAGVIHVREQYLSLDGVAKVTSELKTPCSCRTVPMPPALLAHMIRVKKTRPTGYLFDVTNGHLGVRFYDRLRNMSKLDCRGNPRAATRGTGVFDFYIHPHLLRHTFASICVQAGMDVKEVQYLLGHSTPDMTLQIYAHYLEESRREETAEHLEAAFG